MIFKLQLPTCSIAFSTRWSISSRGIPWFFLKPKQLSSSTVLLTNWLSRFTKYSPIYPVISFTSRLFSINVNLTEDSASKDYQSGVQLHRFPTTIVSTISPLLVSRETKPCQFDTSSTVLSYRRYICQLNHLFHLFKCVFKRVLHFLKEVVVTKINLWKQCIWNQLLPVRKGQWQTKNNAKTLAKGFGIS